MKRNSLRAWTLMALAACSAFMAPAARAATSTDGDLFLGVRATGGTGATKDVVINLGSASNFTSGTATTLSLGNLGADLTSIFGAGWQTRSDLFWGIAGSTGAFSSLGNDPAKTLFATRARLSPSVVATPWTRRSDTAQGTTVGKLSSMMTAFNASASSGVATNSVQQNTTDTNSWASYQPGGTTTNSGPAPGISFATFNPTIEGNASAVLDLFRMRPATAAAPSGTPGDYLGTFSISGTGVVSYTPTTNPFYTLNTQSYTVLENSGTMSITITREGDLTNATTVDFSTVNGTAIAGTDFTAVSNQTIEFAEFQTTATANVTVLNRSGINGSRTFSIALSNPIASVLGSSSTAQVTITESESSFAFASATASVGEATGSVVLTINRTGRTDNATTVLVSTANGTGVAGTDYTAQTNVSVNFAAGETSKTIAIPVTNRPGIRASRTFTANLGLIAGATLLGSPTTATVTITEADTLAAMTGPSSSATPYIRALDPSFFITSIMTVGDSFGGYQMAGIPDGMGAFDNNDGTFTLLMHHELGNTSGSTRAHGAIGAFVSSWIINKTTLQVQSGADLMQQVFGWDTVNQVSNNTTSTVAFNRFCSADLPAVSAFYNAATGLGTQERLFMGGEEGGANGYAMTHVATGANKGKSYILGKFNLTTNGSGLTGVGAWETLCANPFPQDKTVVIGNNDGGTGIMNNSVSVYVGNKTSSGTEADKAGLTNGTLYFVNVTGSTAEIVNTTTRATNITSGTAFTLSSTAATTFSRPEDGAWNPLNPAQYYFVTTDQLNQVPESLGTQIGRTRLWRLTFTDITNPTLGGVIDLLAEGGTGTALGATTPFSNDANMWDNMGVSADGKLILQEDPGNTVHNAKMWFFNPATNALTRVTQSDPARFGDTTIPATAPFNVDEENSGIIDVTALLGGNALTGDRLWLTVTQAHYSLAAPLVEGGQLQLIRQSAPLTTPFLGVSAGDADSTSVTLWTRYNNATAATINVQVSTNSAFTGSPTTVTSGTISAANDWTSKVRVTGLTPGNTYFYRFYCPTTLEVSGTGSFKTAPAKTSSSPVRFAFSGDNDGLMRPYPVASSIPAQGLDFYINLGDVIYENASNVAGNNGASWLNSPSVTLSNSALNLNGVPVGGTTFATAAQLFTDYNKKYRENFLPVNLGGQNSLKDMYAAVGMYVTWDNHELGNRKYIDGGAPAGGPVGGPSGNDMATGAGVDARNNGSGNVGNVNDVNTSSSDFMNRATGWQVLRDVFLNNMPIADRGTISAPTDPRTNGTKQIYTSAQWGKNVVYINTDTRSYRDLRLKTANGGADDTGARAANAGRTMLGATQLAWLKQQLLSAQTSGVKWKFVSVSDPIDQIGALFSGADGGKSWLGGYRAERNALLKWIADNRIINVVFLATDDHTNRINEVTYSPTDSETQATYVKVPYCFSIVCGPLGATGPDTITDHSFSNIQSLTNTFVNSQTSAGVEPLGLVGYPGLKNVTREFDATATTNPQPVDFYSPDTFNYTVLDVSADGQTLTVTSKGINSFAQNAGLEYDATNNPVRTVFSFQVDALSPLDTARYVAYGSTANAGNFANTADSDGDGLPFLMEYALGTNPTAGAGANGVAALPVAVNGSASDDPLLSDRLYLSLSIPQNAPSDVTYTVQTSNTLGGAWTDVARKVGTGSWSWLVGGTPRLFTSSQGPYQLVKVGDAVPRDSSNTRRFMRLQVTTP